MIDWKFKGLGGVWYTWLFYGRNAIKKNLFSDIKPLFFGSTNISENNKSIYILMKAGMRKMLMFDKSVSDSGLMNQSMGHYFKILNYCTLIFYCTIKIILQWSIKWWHSQG